MNKSPISADSIIRQVEEIVASEIDGETVMMSVEMGKYYGLDNIGSRIWELIEDPVKVSDLVEQLTQEFDVDRTTCEKDVLTFLSELVNESIVTVTE